MTKKITLNSLVKCIYEEVSGTEQNELEAALETDFELREEYETLLHAQDQLPSISFNPAQKAIDNILNHSRRTHLEAQV